MAAYQILAVFCVVVLFNTAESLKCYKCNVSQPKADDSCLKNSTSGMDTETCIKGLSKCTITRESGIDKSISHFKRGCHGNFLGLGTKNKCTTKESVETCTTVCNNKDLCNGQNNADMEKCAIQDIGCSTGSLPSQVKFLLIGAVAVVFKIYF